MPQTKLRNENMNKIETNWKNNGKKHIRKNVNGWNGARRNESKNKISSNPLKWMQSIQIESFSVYENEYKILLALSTIINEQYNFWI